MLVLGLSLSVSNGWAWVPPCAIDGSCRILEGRMTGGGSIFTGDAEFANFGVPVGTRVTHGFELYCSVSDGPNNLQFDIHMPDGNGSMFHLDQIVSSYCWFDPAVGNPAPPAAPFNSIFGQGIGRFNGVAGYCADWEFTDAGEPGTNDTIEDLRVWLPTTPGDCRDGHFVFGINRAIKLTFGNHQAHTDNK
jgi:hypothetical protein